MRTKVYKGETLLDTITLVPVVLYSSKVLLEHNLLGNEEAALRIPPHFVALIPFLTNTIVIDLGFRS